MAEPALLELLSLPEVRVGHHGALLVMVWRGEVTFETLEKTDAAQAALAEKLGKLCVLSAITNLVGGLPSAEMRKRSATTMTRFAPTTHGTAIVVTAEGPKAVLVRTFLAGLAMVIDFKSPMRTFRSTGEALDWLSSKHASLKDHALTRAVDAFIAQSRPASR